MINKKAQSMSTNTIILLILGLVILVVLIIGFSTGWSMFKNVMNPTNVDDVVNDCSSACGLKNVYSYCSALREVRINEEDISFQASCAVLASNVNLGRGYFSECGAITCQLNCENIILTNDKGVKYSGKVAEVVPEGAYDVSGLAINLEEGKVCYIDKF